MGEFGRGCIVFRVFRAEFGGGEISVGLFFVLVLGEKFVLELIGMRLVVSVRKKVRFRKFFFWK